MGQDTKISWTDHSFNITWGCLKISPGCDNCYAEVIAKKMGFDVWGFNKTRRTFGSKHWEKPTAWNRKAEKAGQRAKVFCQSMGDIFEDHPTTEAELKKLWPLIRQTPWLDWLLLTKRPENLPSRLPSDWFNKSGWVMKGRGTNYKNVWLGTTIESSNQAERANFLRWIPAAVRFISNEPALGLLDQVDLDGIDWVIHGAESGPNRRPPSLQWARYLRGRCLELKIPFFYKQGSHQLPGQNATLDGQVIQEWPTPRT